MKKKIVKKSAKPTKEQTPRTCNAMKWMAVAFVLGGILGYAVHYSVANWNGFFVTCFDGTRPDKNGCCAGEVYTDAGNGWMVCCPNGGDSCFPPMK